MPSPDGFTPERAADAQAVLRARLDDLAARVSRAEVDKAVEAAALALAADVKASKHGQLCPVWTRAPRNWREAGTPRNLADCDCWVVRNARHDARLAVEAAAPILRGES